MKMRALLLLGTGLLSLLLCLGATVPSKAANVALRTAWIGEFEAFPVWYAKQQGWDKEMGLDVSLLRFGSGPKIINEQKTYNWAIAGCGALPALANTSESSFYIIGIATDEASATRIFARSDSPILNVQGVNPEYPGVYGNAETVRGKTILCPQGTTAHHLLDAWLRIIGLSEKDIKIMNILPEPAVGLFASGHGDLLSVWAPSIYMAEQKGFKPVAFAESCGIRQPIVLLADRTFADNHKEEIVAFLKLYLRGIQTIRDKGAVALADDYSRFTKEWTNQALSRTEAIQDIQNHPVFILEEQLSMFDASKGESLLQRQLRDIAAFHEKNGNPPSYNSTGGFDFVTDTFLKGLAK